MFDKKLYVIIKQAIGEDGFTRYTSNFKTRIVTQKTIYLLTHVIKNPIKLDYSWNFYLHGPYSSELAHMIYYMYDFIDELREAEKLIQLNGEELDCIRKFHVFFKEIQRMENSNHTLEELMEIASTLIYLKNELNTAETIISTYLNIMKPDLVKKMDEATISRVESLIDIFQN